jgi:hypothetical protein
MAVRRRHLFGGQDLRGFQLRGLRHEKNSDGAVFSPGRRQAPCQDNKRASWPLRLIKAWGRRLPFRQLACQVA